MNEPNNLKEYTRRVRETVRLAETWNPTTPNWKLFNEVNIPALQELAMLYAASANPSDRQFLKTVSSLKTLTTKQKFRLLSVLSKSSMRMS